MAFFRIYYFLLTVAVVLAFGLAKPVESYATTLPASVNVQGNSATGPVITGLTVGATYKLVISGVVNYDSDATNFKVDPQWGGTPDKPTGFWQRYAEPKLNGKGWTASNVGTSGNTAHSYNYLWKADKTSLTFTVTDSNYTDNVGHWTVNISLAPDTTPPSAPLNLTATAISSTQINLAWKTSTDNVGVTCYKLYRKTTGSYTKIATTNGTTLTYQDKSVVANTTYTYQVSACDAAGNESTKSNEASATTPGGGTGGGGTTGSTKFALDLLMHGIGKAGDSASPGIGGNMNPVHTSRPVTIDVYDGQQKLVVTKQGTVNYASASGSFTGAVDMGQLVSSTYEIRAKLTQSLQGIKTVSVTQGAIDTIPQMTLITGDVDNNNIVNALDYNLLLDCYSEFSPAKACDPVKFVKTDLTDDNKVNLPDLNLFLREMTNIYAP